MALSTVLLLRLDLGAAAGFVALATLAASCGGPCSPGLAALPVLLAAMPQPEPLAPSPRPGPVRIEGRVESIRIDLLHDQKDLGLRTRAGLLTLTCPIDLGVVAGDRVTAVARCSHPAIVHHRSSLRAESAACTVQEGPWSVPRACAAMRRSLELALLQLVPPEHGPLLCTLVLGQGTRLQDDLAAAHRATGLSHLLAVSGAHAAMLAWLLGLQPFGGGRRRPVGRVHLWIAMSCLLLYGAITGMEPPVFRALCGYLLVAIGLRLGRRVAAIQALLWPAVLSAIATPAGVLGPSFCLSYAAVFGLSIAGPPHGDSRTERFVYAPVRASFWATLFTAPLTLWFFGQLAPWTILLTPLLAPCIGVMLCASLVAAMLMLFGLPIAGLVHAPLTALADFYVAGLAAADQLPGTPVHAFGTPSTALAVAAAGAGICVAAWIGSRKGTALALALACSPHFLPPSSGEPAAHLFAVGHGQTCLLQLDDGKNVLIDCGSQQHPSLPARKVERSLRTRSIDFLVVTHGDHDHTSAIRDLLRRVPVRAAVLPLSLQDSVVGTALQAHGTTMVWLRPGERWSVRADLIVMAPKPESDSENDQSLWVRARISDWTLLASGDAEEAGVSAALSQGIATRADVLVLPHHGRPNEGALALLRAVSPRLCLASNQHGDGVSALGRLALAQGIETLATAVAGDLVVQGRDHPNATAVDTTHPLPR